MTEHELRSTRPSPAPETQSGLVLRLQSPEDQEAWDSFAQHYDAFLTHLIRRLGIPRDHIADARQQILLSVADSVNAFQPDGQQASFRRWLSVVGRHAVLKYIRSQRRHPPAVGGSEATHQVQQLEAADDPHQDQLNHELIIWAANRVRKHFSETSWTAFWETMIQCRPIDEVARELGVSPGSIYMSRSRILRSIRATIREVDA